MLNGILTNPVERTVRASDDSKNKQALAEPSLLARSAGPFFRKAIKSLCPLTGILRPDCGQVC
jgi:hypothetical protein